MRTLIKNGRIVTAVDDYHADLLIVDGTIAEIARNITDSDAEVLDARGRMVIPGGVDPHTHLESFPGRTTTSDDFLTGSRAAAVGGTTTLIDFAKQGKGDMLTQVYDTWQGKARGRTCIDYAFHLIVVEVDQARLEEIPWIIAQGVTSAKMYMAYRGRLMVDDGTIFRTMQVFKQHGGLVALHAENGDVIDVLIQQALAAGHTAPKYHAKTRPPVAEAEAVFRAICIAEIAECPVYFVHMSSRQAVEQLQRARDRGLPVFAETCPHYLLLDESLYDQPGFEGGKYVLTRRCALWNTRRRCGPGCARATLRSFPPITVLTALPTRKPSARTIFQRFPTVGRASKTVCHSSTMPGCMAAASTIINSSI